MTKRFRIIILSVVLAVISCCGIGLVMAKYMSTLPVGTFDLSVVTDKRVFAVVDNGEMTVYHRLVRDKDGDDTTMIIENGDEDIEVEKSKVYHFHAKDNVMVDWGFTPLETLSPSQTVNKASITKITIFDEIALQSAESLFDGFSNCTGIYGLNNLNTEHCENFSHMFYNCSSLTTLDVSKFNTSNATTMQWMFGYAANLTDEAFKNILNTFDTSKVTDFYGMFRGCSTVTTLDLSTFYTEQLATMKEMFYGCSNLKTLTFAPYDETNQKRILVSSMDQTFTGCSKIEEINLSMFDTSTITTMDSLFMNCTALKQLDLSNFDTSKVKSMKRMFDNCSALSNIIVGDKFSTAKVTTMQFMFSKTQLTDEVFASILKNFDTSNVEDFYGMFWNCSKVTTLDLSHFNTESATDMHEMFQNCSSLVTLTLSENFKTDKVTNMHQMFLSCSQLTEINLSGFDTSNVKDMSSMFNGCKTLTELDLSKFNTTNVQEMDRMFLDCNGLETITVGDGFKTLSVKTMQFMFGRATKLADDDFAAILSGFDTSNVTDFYGMFSGCNMTTLDLSHFKTNSPASMQEMFQNCKKLTTLTFYNTSNPNSIIVSNLDRTFAGCEMLTALNLSAFNTTNVQNMYSLFSGCKALTTITVGDGFDTSNVMNMAWMFASTKLTDDIFENLLSKFKTSKVTNFYGMFSGCTAVTELDLSMFNTSSATSMQEMFDKCNALTTIYVSDNFVTTNVDNSGNMFRNCSALEGGADTTIATVQTKDAENYLTAKYARIDGGVGYEGYFTDIADKPAA